MAGQRMPCPHCGNGLAVEPAMAGRDVLCPHCRQGFRMPPMAQPIDDASAVQSFSHCPFCGGQLAYSPELAGQDCKCPLCDGVFVMPDLGGPPQDNPFDIVAESVSEQARRRAGPDETPREQPMRCWHCGSQSISAVTHKNRAKMICLSCGTKWEPQGLMQWIGKRCWKEK